LAAPLNQNVNITVRFENQKAVTNIKNLNVNMRGLATNVNRHTTSLRKNKVAMKQVNDEAFKFRVATPRMRRNIGAVRNEILLLVFAFGGLVAAMKKAIDANVQLESALLGLGAVAQKVGESRFKAMEEASKLAASGLISITDASAGLKNLMSTGNFTLQKSVNIMKALADAAAFNRQGTLSYGEAIVGATQGIKNQNSIMVDNAGITKNLSIMYQEFATQIGTTVGKLTEAQKFQAIYNGMLREASIFTGNAALVTETLAGAQAKLGVTMFEMRAVFGDIISEGYQAAVKAMQKLTESTRSYLSANKEMLKQKIKDVVMAITAAVVALTKAFIFFAKPLAIVGQHMGSLLKIYIAMKILSKLTILHGLLITKYLRLTTATKAATLSTVAFNKAILAGTTTAFSTAIPLMAIYITNLTLMAARLPVIGKLFTGLYLTMLKFNSALVTTSLTTGSIGAAFTAIMPQLIAIGGAITLLVVLWKKYRSNLKKVSEDTTKLQLKQIRERQETVEKLRDQNAEVVKLSRRYKELGMISTKTVQDEAELLGIQERLAEITPELNREFGSFSDSLNRVGISSDVATSKLDNFNKMLLRNRIAELGIQSNISMNKLDESLTEVNKSFKSFNTTTGFLVGTDIAGHIKGIMTGIFGLSDGMVITEKNARGLNQAVDILLGKFIEQRTTVQKGTTEYERLSMVIASLSTLWQDVSGVNKQIDAADRFSTEINKLNEMLKDTTEVSKKSAEAAKDVAKTMLKTISPESMIKLKFGVAGDMQERRIELKNAVREIDMLLKEHGNRVTFNANIEVIDLSKQVQAASKIIETELKKIRGVDVADMTKVFLERLRAAGIEEKKITNKMETIIDKMRTIKRLNEERVKKARELLKLQKEGSVPQEAVDKANELIAASEKMKQVGLDKYFESWLSSVKDTTEVVERLLDRIQRFVNKGKKAFGEANISLMDRVIGGDRAGKEDAINRARTTMDILINDVQDHMREKSMTILEGLKAIEDIQRAFRNIEINEERKHNEEKIQNVLNFMERLVGSYDQLGVFLANRSAGVKAEADKRIRETEKLYKEEVISFEEKERQLRRIEQASREERLKLEQAFWNNMIKVTANAVSKILTDIATANIAKRGLAGLSMGNIGLLGLGIGIPLLAGLFGRKKEIGMQDTGFAGLEQPTRDTGGADRDRLTGAITARELQIVLAPSIVIEGETIIIGSIGVEELKTTMGDAVVESVQAAIDNREINLGDIPAVR
jgi:hypothetical protein